MKIKSKNFFKNFNKKIEKFKKIKSKNFLKL